MEPAEHGAAEGVSGGIVGLVRILREFGGAVEYDLLRINRHIDELGETLSWRDLLVVVVHAQPDTATHKALNEKWPVTSQTELLRSIEYSSRMLVWMKTEEARRGVGRPEPVRWPWEAVEDDGAIRGDSVSWEEAEERWGRDMRARNALIEIPDAEHDAHVAFPEED